MSSQARLHALVAHLSAPLAPAEVEVEVEYGVGAVLAAARAATGIRPT